MESERGSGVVLKRRLGRIRRRERTQRVRSTAFPRNPERCPEEAEDSALSRSRGKEQHITPFGLEKMIINIKEKTDLEPLPPTIAVSLPAIPPTLIDNKGIRYEIERNCLWKNPR